jgi:cytochrome c551/c552
MQPAALRAVTLLGIVLIAAGCADSRPNGKIVTPTPTKIVGTAPKPAAVSATAGGAVFKAQGCAACHTFKAAGATGKVGPDLDNLAQYAKVANQGTLQQFVSTSITDPGAYVQPGFANGIMPTSYSSLSSEQLADLVAFLTK